MLALLALALACDGQSAPRTEFLSDLPDRMVQVEQGWGELGFDVCAHAQGQTPLALQIGSQTFRKGLGHHAAGTIVVDLEGRYLSFDATVGVQKQALPKGSVGFTIYVDGEKRFYSGVMLQTTPPKPVHLDVQGAQELRLVADDAGDGIICDCADWADARLIVSPMAKPIVRSEFDFAPFGEVTTWNPARMDGARASRIEEFHAEDVYLDQPVKQNASGGYRLPESGCIGLLWMERRRPTTLTLDLQPGSPKFDTTDVQVQAWTSLYPFQGSWSPLVGTFASVGTRLTFKLDAIANSEIRQGFRKVRWIFPVRPHGQVFVARLGATRPIRMKTAKLRLEAAPDKRGIATITPATCSLDGRSSLAWNMRKPIVFTVHIPVALGSTEGSGQPALHFALPESAFTIEIGDAVSGNGVYLKDEGVYLSQPRHTLREHKSQIAGKQTILQRVRSKPDQTFGQAMKSTYRDVHFGSPTLLSLGADNWKWLVEPNGTTVWQPSPEVAERQMPFEDRRCLVGISFNGALLRPANTPNSSKGMKRWMPVVTLEGGRPGALCRYTAYVAPVGVSGRSLYVGKIDLGGQKAESLELTFQQDRNRKVAARIDIEGDRAKVMDGDRLMAVVDLSRLASYQATAERGVLHITGKGNGSLVMAIPGWKADVSDHELRFIDADKLADAFIHSWNTMAGEGMQIQIPDAFLSNIIQSSRVRCMVDARSQGNGKRIAPWIAEIHYGPLESEANTIIRGMALMGHREFAKRSLDYFINLYAPAGYLTTGYTLVGTGWHLWTLGEAFGLSNDKAWMKGHAADVARVCRWVIGERRKTMKLDPLGRKPPQYGLVTPGVIADWNAYQYYFYSNGTYCAGLAAAGKALKAIGYPEADSYIAESRAFSKDIVRAYRWVQARTPANALQDGSWVPGQPSQVHCPGPLSGYFAGEDASRSWCYDVEIGAHNLLQQGILPAIGKDSQQMADHLEDVMFLKDGWGDYPAAQSQRDWFNLGGFAKVQPYYGRLTEVYAMRDDVKPFIRSYFNMIASLIDPSNLTIWEHFDHMGAPDKTHETGVFLQQTRFMFVNERGSELWLSPFVTSNWMEDGNVVSIQHAPTLFGETGYRIESHIAKGYIDAVVDPPTRSSPSAIVLRLRHPRDLRMKSVTVNGKQWSRFDPVRETVTLPVALGRLRVRAVY